MPELPEIETIKNSLQKIVGSKIIGIEIMRNDIIRNKDFSPKEIYDSPINEITRRGKYLVLSFENKLHIIIHLGMSGRVYLDNTKDFFAKEQHVHVIIHFRNNKRLIYQDPRRFGGVWFIKDLNAFFSRLGIEPLAEEFNPEYLENITKGRRIAIKSLLLVQNLISGIGNIYADEALFEAKIKPNRPAQSLSKQEIQNLCYAIKHVLQKSIEYRGTTFRDYRDGFNQPGSFQHQLNVYGKINQGCPLCDEILKRERIGGRSSFFCPNCQR